MAHEQTRGYIWVPRKPEGHTGLPTEVVSSLSIFLSLHPYLKCHNFPAKGHQRDSGRDGLSLSRVGASSTK